jgi:transcriptional regulator with XRE-family HTH domain
MVSGSVPGFSSSRARRARRRAGLTQQQVADEVGVHSRTVMAWEKGHRAPAVPSFAALTQLLGVEPRELLEPIGRPATIQALRARRALTQTDAAERLAITERTWRRIETGQALPRGITFQPLTTVLGVDEGTAREALRASAGQHA